jgi:hypothetical protein
VVVSALRPLLAPKFDLAIDVISQLSNLALALIFSGISVVLYFWRSRALFTYGWAEVLVGIAAMDAKVPALNERGSISAWITLVLAVYIIVRGMDNIGKALGKARKPLFLFDTWIRIFGKNSVA